MVINLNRPRVEGILRKGFGYTPLNYGEDLAEVQEFEGSLKKNKLIVKEILEGWSPATNNDSLLYLEFLRTKYPEIEVTSGEKNIIFKIPKYLIKTLTSPESVTRARRVLNNKGIGLPSDEGVFKRRMKRQKAIQQYFRSNNG